MNEPLQITHFIDGRFDASSAEWIELINPATGSSIGQVASGTSADVDRAVAAAARALPSWRAKSPTERGALLHRLADLIERDVELLAAAECRNSGKPITLAREVEVPRAAANFRFFAECASRFGFEERLENDQSESLVIREGAGIAGCISPWNLPLYLFTWKIAPALAAGCTVVSKPSEVTPVTAWMVGRLAIEAGVPPGVLNIVHGLGAVVGSAIVAHPNIPVLSFTGSTSVGESIARTTAPLFKRVALEMGGKNAAIVFADANLEAAADGVVQSAFRNQGQICLCTSRVVVERSIAPRFTSMLIERTASLRSGDPTSPSTQQGALVSSVHRDKVLLAIQCARDAGARVLCGGRAVPPESLPASCQGGYFVEPTILAGLPSHCKTNQNEIFGPVVSLLEFKDEPEAIEIANDSMYGLAASIWSSDAPRVDRVARALEVGIVWNNCWMVRDLRTPFGGTKRSGLGREGGDDALRHFTEPKSVTRSKA
ncbi:MAG: aldehyde dehydrogenase [Planctomycetota bacterium]|nr:aldehyde dehydrogenase [Planctomycetota bacterium]